MHGTKTKLDIEGLRGLVRDDIAALDRLLKARLYSEVPLINQYGLPLLCPWAAADAIRAQRLSQLQEVFSGGTQGLGARRVDSARPTAQQSCCTRAKGHGNWHTTILEVWFRFSNVTRARRELIQISA